MWGSIFDATKDFAEKARKAAEELERNLNDSAGVTTTTGAAVTTATTSLPSGTSEQHQVTSDDNVIESSFEQNEAGDDSLNDAWDDEDVDNIDQQIDMMNNNNVKNDITEDVENDILTSSDTIDVVNAPSNHQLNEASSQEHLQADDAAVNIGNEVEDDSNEQPQILPSNETQSPIMNDEPSNVIERSSITKTESTIAVTDNTASINDTTNDQTIINDNDNLCHEQNTDIDENINGSLVDVELNNDSTQVNNNNNGNDDNNHHNQIQHEVVIHSSTGASDLVLDEVETLSTTLQKGNENNNVDIDTTVIDTDHMDTAYDDADTTDSVEPQIKLAEMTNQGINIISSFFGSSTNTNTSTVNTDTIHNEGSVTHDNQIDINDDLNNFNTKQTIYDHDEEVVDNFDAIDNKSISTEQIKISADGIKAHQEITDDALGNDTHEQVEEVISEPLIKVTDDDEQYEEPQVDDKKQHDPVDSAMTIQTKIPLSILDSDDNIESILEKLMSNDVTLQLLEQKYHLVSRSAESNDAENVTMELSIKQLQDELHQREQQLFSKTEQITMMEAMHETEKQELLAKIQSTKDEAKRRIQKAKERVDAVELKLSNLSSHQNTSVAAKEELIQQQATIITELRKEGEKLAQKQADMELIVRSAKGETRELRNKIVEMEDEAAILTEKFEKLEIEYKKVQNELSLARQGISQVDHLDNELRTIRAENEKRATTILTLEQEIKELKSTKKEIEKELTAARKGAAIETEQERKRLIMDHNHIVSDLEMKLQSIEREAAIREDALRVEIDDIRKRWQDAVRRADTLSVDIQANTAPLLRQIDSINKQSRIRATAWAELETQLRNEIENSIIVNETLTKECNEWKTKYGRLERANKEMENDLKQSKLEIYEKNETLQKLQHQYDEAMKEVNQLKASIKDMERLSNEGIARVRSEMTRTMVDNEDRYRMQIESLEQQIQDERNQRSKLEVQLLEQQSYRNDSDRQHNIHTGESAIDEQQQQFNDDNDRKKQRLRQSQDQTEILAGALGGLHGDEDDDYANEDSDTTYNEIPRSNGNMNSYAALEELTSRLKASKLELSTLRTRLMESEKVRNELIALVEESRIAREKLPLFEQRVQELTVENNKLQLEIQGLKEDIADVRELYRTQLNVLIEAQAVTSGDSKSLLGVGDNSDDHEVTVSQEQI